ncbi:DIP1984 family protein [Xanthomonas fragariae]|uniref:hypothetical protein n=2 Tax=Xanthomonas fragariae TaxID=48664 RepID=UPI001ABDBE21|nr:hypothetical protein [Xanthomonas fragariae]UKR52701.1 DIP1984 family protein [Xanthomonas fragariae]
MGNTCARGISSSQARMSYDAQVQKKPVQQAPATPGANQSPLDGLAPRPHRGAGPSRPMRPVEKWDKDIRQSVRDMAHDFFQSNSPIFDKLDMRIKKDVIQMLKQMLGRVGGELKHGGRDDFMERIKQIQQRIDKQSGNAPALNPAAHIETADNLFELEQMQQLMCRIELALEEAKAGDPSPMELVPCPTLNRGLVNAASDMASLFKTRVDETGASPLTQEVETRIQNLLGNILKGESVPRGVANAVAELNNDPKVLLGKLLALVERFPDLGKLRTTPP